MSTAQGRIKRLSWLGLGCLFAAAAVPGAAEQAPANSFGQPAEVIRTNVAFNIAYLDYVALTLESTANLLSKEYAVPSPYPLTDPKKGPLFINGVAELEKKVVGRTRWHYREYLLGLRRQERVKELRGALFDWPGFCKSFQETYSLDVRSRDPAEVEKAIAFLTADLAARKVAIVSDQDMGAYLEVLSRADFFQVMAGDYVVYLTTRPSISQASRPAAAREPNRERLLALDPVQKTKEISSLRRKYDRSTTLFRPAEFVPGRPPFWGEAEYYRRVMQAGAAPESPKVAWRNDSNPLRAYLNRLRARRGLTFDRLAARFNLDFFSTEPNVLKLAINVLEQDLLICLGIPAERPAGLDVSLEEKFAPGILARAKALSLASRKAQIPTTTMHDWPRYKSDNGVPKAIHRLKMDSRGRIWCVGSNVSYFDGLEWVTYTDRDSPLKSGAGYVPSTGAGTFALAEGRNHSMWFGGLLFRYDSDPKNEGQRRATGSYLLRLTEEDGAETWKEVDLPAGEIFSDLTANSAGDLLVGTGSGAIYAYDEAGDKWTKIYTSPEWPDLGSRDRLELENGRRDPAGHDVQPNFPQRIFLDFLAPDRVWIVNRGVFVWESGRGLTGHMAPFVGTGWQPMGLRRFWDFIPRPYAYTRPAPPIEMLRSRPPNAVGWAEAKPWMESGSWLPLHRAVRNQDPADGLEYWATSGGNLYHLPEKADAWMVYRGLGAAAVGVDHSRRVWVTGASGLICYDRCSWQRYQLPEKASHVLVDSAGVVYVAGDELGVVRTAPWVDGTLPSEDFDGDGTVNSADADADGDGLANDEDPFPYDPSNNPDEDGDGLRLADEDKNGNGVVDPEETDPHNPDSDFDGLLDNVDRMPTIRVPSPTFSTEFPRYADRATIRYTAYWVDGQALKDPGTTAEEDLTSLSIKKSPLPSEGSPPQLTPQAVQAYLGDNLKGSPYEVWKVEGPLNSYRAKSDEHTKNVARTGSDAIDYRYYYGLYSNAYDATIHNREPGQSLDSRGRPLSLATVTVGVCQGPNLGDGRTSRETHLVIQFSIRPGADLASDPEGSVQPAFEWQVHEREGEEIHNPANFICQHVTLAERISQDGYEARLVIPRETGGGQVWLTLVPMFVDMTSGERTAIDPQDLTFGALVREGNIWSFSAVARPVASNPSGASPKEILASYLDRLKLRPSRTTDLACGDRVYVLNKHDVGHSSINWARFPDRLVPGEDQPADLIVFIGEDATEVSAFRDETLRRPPEENPGPARERRFEAWRTAATGTFEEKRRIYDSYDLAQKRIDYAARFEDLSPTLYNVISEKGYIIVDGTAGERTTLWMAVRREPSTGAPPEEEKPPSYWKVDCEKRLIPVVADAKSTLGETKSVISLVTTSQSVIDYLDVEEENLKNFSKWDMFGKTAYSLAILSTGTEFYLLAVKGEENPAEYIHLAASSGIKLSSGFLQLTQGYKDWAKGTLWKTQQGSLSSKMFTKGNAFSSGVALLLGTVEVTYYLYKADTTQDPLEKEQYQYAAAGAGIDAGISAIPVFGTYFQTAFAASYFVSSLIINYAYGNEGGYKSSKNFGEALTGWAQYEFGHGRSEDAKDAFEKAMEKFVQRIARERGGGRPYLFVPPSR